MKTIVKYYKVLFSSVGAILALTACAATQQENAQPDSSSISEQNAEVKTVSKLVLEGFKTGEVIDGNAVVVDDGQGLMVDTMPRANAESPWNRVFEFPKNMFEKNKTYTVSMKVSIVESAPDGQGSLLFIVRRHSSGSGDALCSGVSTAINGKLISEQFTGADGAYSFQIHTSRGVKAYLTDLKIVEGRNTNFVPMFEDKTKAEIDRKSLPKGCKEFDVDAPNNPDGEVVEAKRFGIVPGGKNLISKINKALDYCREKKASKLLFEKDAVYFMPENQNIGIKNMKDFTFDANGSTFIFALPKGQKFKCGSFTIAHCERTEVRNLNVDWDWDNDPLASIGKIVAKRESNKEGAPYIDFELIDYKKFPYSGKVRIATISCYNMPTRSVGIENGATHGGEMIPGRPGPKAEIISDNILRLHSMLADDPRMKIGNFYRIQHYYYDGCAFSLISSKHTTLRNVNLYSTTGHGFVMGGTQKYTYFKNVNIVLPKDKPKQVITTTGDHFHITKSCGYIKLEDCDFSQGADDCINFHDNSSYGKRNSANSIISRHDYAADGAVVEFRRSDYSPLKFKAQRMKSVKLADEKYEIFFDKEIPETEDNQYIMFDRTYNTSNLIIRNCYFHQNRARGLLILARNVTVENCRFYRNEMGAIKLETGYTLNIWCEGYGVRNVVVRGCTFDSSNPLGAKHFGYERDISFSAYLRRDPSSEQTTYPILNKILFENNTFIDTYGMIATIGSSGNVTFLNNTFIYKTPRENPLDYRGSFFAKSSSNIKILNNTYIGYDSLAKNLGVYIEPGSVKNLVVKGNKLVESEKK